MKRQTLRVKVPLTPAQHAEVKALAQKAGQSMVSWIADAVAIAQEATAQVAQLMALAEDGRQHEKLLLDLAHKAMALAESNRSATPTPQPVHHRLIPFILDAEEHEEWAQRPDADEAWSRLGRVGDLFVEQKKIPRKIQGGSHFFWDFETYLRTAPVEDIDLARAAFGFKPRKSAAEPAAPPVIQAKKKQRRPA